MPKGKNQAELDCISIKITDKPQEWLLEIQQQYGHKSPTETVRMLIAAEHMRMMKTEEGA